MLQVHPGRMELSAMRNGAADRRRNVYRRTALILIILFCAAVWAAVAVVLS